MCPWFHELRRDERARDTAADDHDVEDVRHSVRTGRHRVSSPARSASDRSSRPTGPEDGPESWSTTGPGNTAPGGTISGVLASTRGSREVIQMLITSRAVAHNAGSTTTRARIAWSASSPVSQTCGEGPQQRCPTHRDDPHRSASCTAPRGRRQTDVTRQRQRQRQKTCPARFTPGGHPKPVSFGASDARDLQVHARASTRARPWRTPCRLSLTGAVPPELSRSKPSRLTAAAPTAADTRDAELGG